ncbi:lysophospholipase [Ancylomarina euxinus]|uniref:Lysophospholipase n=1 Tax=Ancylomarina euxinus TaxID=2283627 RepID=A0A425XZ17_9BACT|nr:alpha/beta hydrolase [Ancylomarina euxinus]MCZ4695617.1 lysophospholipase [Ancylomarina euxinus]MUP16079.1 alpha/beta fold hydrolase [Ancylomarina euxinus]RRG20322.1 lysophospholipase [Ancylomarina euxinus]
MTRDSKYIITADGTKLFSQMWKPDLSPDCVICLIHGIGEHSSRYDAWAIRFVSNNIALVTFDQRGHGQSEGKRGVIPSFNVLLDDIDLLLSHCEKLFPNTPIVLYGHSMGGGEVLTHLYNRDGRYKAVIATSPWLIAQQSPPKFLIPIVKLFSQWFPKLSLKTKLNSNLLSHDPIVVENYKNDTLVHSWVSFRLFYQAYQAGCSLLNQKSVVTRPLLLLHGTADEITSHQASHQFAGKAGQLCEFHVFDNAFHELHNDSCKDEVFDLILAWIHKNVNPSL